MPSSFDIIAPAGFAEPVTPNDTTDLAQESRAFFIGGAGNIVLRCYNPATNKKADVTFTGVTAGSTLLVRATRVLATGTTATNIVSLS